jgi:hypothetical protein
LRDIREKIEGGWGVSELQPELLGVAAGATQCLKGLLVKFERSERARGEKEEIERVERLRDSLRERERVQSLIFFFII